MKITYSQHAREKLSTLQAHRVDLSEEFIEEALLNPDKIVSGFGGRLIAQKALDDRHVLRVVYTLQENQIRVVTLYPARREGY